MTEDSRLGIARRSVSKWGLLNRHNTSVLLEFYVVLIYRFLLRILSPREQGPRSMFKNNLQPPSELYHDPDRRLVALAGD